MKSEKCRKVIKGVFLWATILCFCLVTFLALFFSITTKDTNLNNDNLTQANKSIAFIASDGGQIVNTSSIVKISDLQEHTINAFIAKEDKRFYNHNGYDIIRIFGALKNNIKNGEIVEGGSTITQQLIKNTHTNSEKTIKRKMNELKLASILEREYSKKEILEMYLNTIYFGNNCYGIQSASITYFGTNAKDLTLAQSAVLAGLISAPSAYNPITNKRLSLQKAEIVLTLMLEQNYINEQSYKKAVNDLSLLQINSAQNNHTQYLSYAISEACQILGVNELTNTENIEIETYLNSSLQTSLETKVYSGEYNIPNRNGITPDIGSVILDNKTGGIIAFAGNSQYNLQTLKRQPASTIKPILVYAPAIEDLDYSPCSLILDEPINIDGYTPTNATKMYYGYTSVRDNIVRSTNIPAVKLLQELGVENAKAFAQNLGISFDKNDTNLALALGGFTQGVTLTEMAGAYSTFARDGYYIKPTFIKSITVNGKVVYSHTSNASKVMESSTAYLITDMLKSVAQYGTGRKIKSLGNFIASKTGTNATENNNLDAWNASYTTKHTAVCWIGNTNGETGSMNPSVNGSTYATTLIKDMFSELYSENRPADFKQPSTVTTAKIDLDIYNNEHKVVRVTENSNNTKTELFKIDALPSTYTHEQVDEIIENTETLNNLFSIKIM